MQKINKDNIIKILERYDKPESKIDWNEKVKWNDYDKIKANKKHYPVYDADVKNYRHADIDPSKAEWCNEISESNFVSKGTDKLEYRLKMCANEEYEIMDLNYLTPSHVSKFFKSSFFKRYASTIQHLFIEECGLEKLPDLSLMTNLKTLDISHNRIKVIEELPETLTELFATDNGLTKLPYKMRKMEKLYVFNNNLKELGSMKKLLYMDMSNNKISKLTHNYPLIKDLSCNDNPITELTDMINLGYLNMSKTEIKRLSNYPKLKYVVANSSKLKYIFKLPSLVDLVIIRSNLKYLPVFPALKNLCFMIVTILTLRMNTI